MIKLRELRIEDASIIAEIFSDEDTMKNFIHTRYPKSIESFEEFIKNSWGNKDNIHFGVANEDSEFVGVVSLKEVDYVSGTAEYAIALRKKFWGMGYAKESTSLILKYGFNRLNLKKIYLNVPKSNVRANKFYNKFGFVLEATFKKHIFIDGEYVDLNWYCKIKE